MVGPVRMYHFSMTPTAGQDIGRHDGSRPQMWQLGRHGGAVGVDVVLRYEHLDADLSKLCAHRGTEAAREEMSAFSAGDCQAALEAAPNFGGEDHEHLLEYLSSERVNLWEIVNEAFKEDFEALGYPKVSSADEYRQKYMPLRLDAIGL